MELRAESRAHLVDLALQKIRGRSLYIVVEEVASQRRLDCSNKLVSIVALQQARHLSAGLSEGLLVDSLEHYHISRSLYRAPLRASYSKGCKGSNLRDCLLMVLLGGATSGSGKAEDLYDRATEPRLPTPDLIGGLLDYDIRQERPLYVLFFHFSGYFK